VLWWDKCLHVNDNYTDICCAASATNVPHTHWSWNKVLGFRVFVTLFFETFLYVLNFHIHWYNYIKVVTSLLYKWQMIIYSAYHWHFLDLRTEPRPMHQAGSTPTHFVASSSVVISSGNLSSSVRFFSACWSTQERQITTRVQQCTKCKGKVNSVHPTTVAYRGGGVWEVQTPPWNSEVLTESNWIANWVENV
jgi:hypothetical protein